jgi:hypothetical protein
MSFTLLRGGCVDASQIGSHELPDSILFKRILPPLLCDKNHVDTEFFLNKAKEYLSLAEENEHNFFRALPYLKLSDKKYYNQDIQVFISHLSTKGMRTFDWLTDLADQGLSYPQYLLGHLYYANKGGIEKNSELALKYLKWAAYQGNERAQYMRTHLLRG